MYYKIFVYVYLEIKQFRGLIMSKSARRKKIIHQGRRVSTNINLYGRKNTIFYGGDRCVGSLLYINN